MSLLGGSQPSSSRKRFQLVCAPSVRLLGGQPRFPEGLLAKSHFGFLLRTLVVESSSLETCCDEDWCLLDFRQVETKHTHQGVVSTCVEQSPLGGTPFWFRVALGNSVNHCFQDVISFAPSEFFQCALEWGS